MRVDRYTWLIGLASLLIAVNIYFIAIEFSVSNMLNIIVLIILLALILLKKKKKH